MDDEQRQRLDRIEQRLAAVGGTMNGLAVTVDVMREEVRRLLAWTQEKPSSELPELLVELVTVMHATQEAVLALGQLLPGALAEAVRAELRRP